MRTRSIISGFAFVAGLAAMQPAFAQHAQAPLGILAQAYDRCMTTYAVRLTKTAASDDAIFAQAAQSCLALKSELTAAIRAQVPAAQAADLLEMIDTRAKPDFLVMLARIRQDRAARPSG